MSIDKEVKKKWGALQDALAVEVAAFMTEYASNPASARSWKKFGVGLRRDQYGEPGDPAHKQRRWTEMWCRSADMITAFAADYSRSAPHDAAWTVRAEAFLQSSIFVLHRRLRREHPDVPEFKALELDPVEGKHRARARDIDVLESIYYCLYEDPDNAKDIARMTDAQRAKHAADGRQFRELLDSFAGPPSHLRRACESPVAFSEGDAGRRADARVTRGERSLMRAPVTPA